VTEIRRSVRPVGLLPRTEDVPLQGEAKKLYQRDYMRRRRAGLSTRTPRPKGQCCSVCGRPPSRERIVIDSGRGVRICEDCVAEVAALIAAQRA
jgi:ClpX C4-type zinc finger